MKRNFFRMLAVVGILGLYAACSDNSTVAPKPQAGQTPLFSATIPANGTGACMGNDAFASGFTSGMGSATDLNCTANDIDIAFATVTQYSFTGTAGPFTALAQGDSIECTGGQAIYVKTHAFLQNNAQSRYDIGLWIATDGGTAVTGTCNHYNLVVGAPGVSNLEVAGQQDQCGDMAQGSGLADVDLDVLTLTCPSTGASSVSVGACVGWQNSDDFNQRGLCPTDPPGGSLGFRYGTVPETKSKCNCEPFLLPVIVKASLTLVKVVTNNSGGTKTVSDFPLTATGPTSINGVSGTTAVTARPVTAGTYALSEQTQTGYTPSSWSCSGGTQSGSNITLSTGGAATCTISNDDQPASLTLVKVVTNNNGGTKTVSDFPLTATGPTSINGVSGTTAVTGRSVSAGTYALTEQTQSGYSASTWSCSGGTQSGANITLGLAGSATCTISNDDQTANLTLVKVVTNNNGGTKTLSDFPLTATGPTSINGVSGTTAVTGRSVNAGAYALTEQTQAGYTASTWSCSGGTQSGANITLGLGGSATCTISNDDVGASLTLVKVVTNNSGGTKTLSDFPLTATGPVTISGVSGTTSVTNRGVNAGTYALTEQTQAGYTPSTWSCSGGTQSGANITLGLGGGATCTISNDDNPAHLTLVKVVTNDNGGTKTLSDFPLTATGPTSINGVSGTTAVTGRAVSAGSYALTEQTQTGYAPSTWSCSGGTQTGANIALGLDGSATCTISNDDIAPKLIIKKTVIGTGTVVGFTATSNGSFITSPFNLTPPTNSSDSVVYTTTAKAGAFSVTEGALAGYLLTDLGCSDQPVGTYNPASTRTVVDTLSLGETVTCTFINQQQASGTTRTQGYWATHSSVTNVIWFGGTLDGVVYPGVAAVLGDITLCGRDLNTLSIVLGGFWSNIAKTTDGTKRSALDQARMRLLQQLLAAELNIAAFGGSPSISIADAEAAYCGTDITAINNAATALAAFNESGDSGVFTPGLSANGKVAKDLANLVFWDVLP